MYEGLASYFLPTGVLEHFVSFKIVNIHNIFEGFVWGLGK